MRPHEGRARRPTTRRARHPEPSYCVGVRPVVFTLIGFGLLTSACLSTPGVSADAGAGDGALGDGSTDSSAFTDGGIIDTGASVDGSAIDAGGDAGLACGILGGTYTDAHKVCASVADCAMIARGCFCGAQPIIGIAKEFVAAAEACETKVGKSCPLGCANFPGHVAEDGKNDIDGGSIKVLCDLGKCHTVLP